MKGIKLSIVGLSNGVHVFETVGKSIVGDCLKRNVTNEVCVALMTSMKMTEIDEIRFYNNGKQCRFKLIENE